MFYYIQRIETRPWNEVNSKYMFLFSYHDPSTNRYPVIIEEEE